MKYFISRVCVVVIFTSCTNTKLNDHLQSPSIREDNQKLTIALDEGYAEYRNNLLKQLSESRGGACEPIAGTRLIRVVPFTNSKEKNDFLTKLENLPEKCKKELASYIVHSVDWENFIESKKYNHISDYDNFVQKNIFKKILNKDNICDESRELLVSTCINENNDFKTDWIHEFVAIWYIKNNVHDTNGWKFLLANMIFEEDETPYFSEITRIVLENNLDKFPLGRKLVEIQKMGPNEYMNKLPMIMKSFH